MLTLHEIQLIRITAWEWCLYYDYEFFSQYKHTQVIADTFQYIIQREKTPNAIINRIKQSPFTKVFHQNYNGKACVSMPPRAGKSYTISVCLGWAIGNFPNESFMRNACTDTLYNKFSYDVRDIVNSAKFYNIFQVKLSANKKNVDGWNTDKAKQVTYFGGGVGGTIIGFGASKVAVTDDLYKGIDDALSETINDKVHRWKESTHDSRLEGNCAVFDVGTRWSLKDVLGKNIDANKYDVEIIIPALVNDITFCDKVKTTEQYNEIRQTIDSSIWFSEYMQEPTEVKGIVFDKNSMKIFTSIEKNNNIIAYIDTADTGKDYFACAIAQIVDRYLYIIDVMFTQANMDFTMPLFVEKIKEHQITNVQIESNTHGAGFIRQIRTFLSDNGIECNIRAINQTSNKLTRILMQSGYIQNRMYFLDESKRTKEYQLFINNITQFTKEGKNKHDDAPDCLAGLAEFSKYFIE